MPAGLRQLHCFDSPGRCGYAPRYGTSSSDANRCDCRPTSKRDGNALSFDLDAGCVTVGCTTSDGNGYGNAHAFALCVVCECKVSDGDRHGDGYLHAITNSDYNTYLDTHVAAA